MRILGVLILALVIQRAPQAVAGPFEDGQSAYDARNFSAAIQIWRPLAEHGDVNAQLGLARVYAGGLGVTRDPTQADIWLRKAADQGNATAQYFLGVSYLAGLGVPQDGAEALKLLIAAANQGVTESQFTVGTVYARGQVVKQSYPDAYYWYEVALEHFAPAANLDAGAVKKMHDSYEKARDETGAKISPAERAQADARAHTWAPIKH